MADHNWDRLFDWSGYADEGTIENIEQLKERYNNNPQKYGPKIGEMIVNGIKLEYGLLDQINDMDNFIYEVQDVNPKYSMWEKYVDEARDIAVEVREIAEELIDESDPIVIDEMIQSIIDTILSAEEIFSRLQDLTTAADAWTNGRWEEYERGGY